MRTAYRRRAGDAEKGHCSLEALQRPVVQLEALSSRNSIRLRHYRIRLVCTRLETPHRAACNARWIRQCSNGSRTHLLSAARGKSVFAGDCLAHRFAVNLALLE